MGEFPPQSSAVATLEGDNAQQRRQELARIQDELATQDLALWEQEMVGAQSGQLVPVQGGEVATRQESAVATQDAPAGEQKPPALGAAEFDEKKLKGHIVDVSSGVHANAEDKAQERIDELTTQSGVKGFLKKIWHGNVVREFNHLRFKDKARKEILETQDLYAFKGTTGQHAEATKAIVDRFTEGYTHEGESTGSMKDVGRYEDGQEHNGHESAGADLESQLKQLVGKFAKNELSEDDFVEVKKKILEEFGSTVSAADRKKGLMFADNVLEVAKNAKAAVAHGAGLERVMAAVEFASGEARVGVRGEAKLNAAERIIDKLQGTKVGSLVNESTLITAVGAGAVAFNLVTKRATSALLRTVSLGAAGAVIAGVRENMSFKKERSKHSRDMAEGGANNTGERLGKRRETLESTRYQTVGASELTEKLSESSERAESWEGMRDTLAALTDARTRIRKSDRDNVDLIHYSDAGSVEGERLALDLKVAEARVALKRALANADNADLARAGINSRDIDDLLDTRTEQALALLEGKDGDMAQRDRAFAHEKWKRVTKAAAIGFVSGEVIGIASQEAIAAVRDDVRGVFESRADGQASATLLGSLHGDSGGTEAQQNVTRVDTGHNKAVINGTTEVAVPKGFMLQESNGAWSLSDVTGNTVVKDVAFDANGQFDAVTQKAFADSGFDTSHGTSGRIETTPPTQTTVERTAGEYIENHKADFTHVERVDSYTNGTENPDHNENDIWWGGVDNTGVDENGNYVLSMASMSADGSWNQGGSVNAQELIANGTMKMAISIDKDNISNVVMVDVDQNGNAIIDKNSFVGQNLFTLEDGKAKFTGGYAEAVEIQNAADGTQQVGVLATVVGENNQAPIADVVTTEGETVTNNVTVNSITQLKTEEIAGTEGLDTQVAPVVPIRARTGLESRPKKEEAESTEPAPVPPVTQPRQEAPAPPTSAEVERRTERPIARKPEDDVIDAELVEEEERPALPRAEDDVIDGEVIEDELPQSPRRSELESSQGSSEPLSRAELESRRQLEASPFNAGAQQITAYGSELRALQEWARQRSSPLKTRREITDGSGVRHWAEADGSPVERSVDRERSSTREYLERETSNDSHYSNMLDIISRDMGPMEPATKVAINVPVWNGASDLTSILPQYLQQTDAQGSPLPANEYEVNILLSHLAATDADSATDAIKKFLTEFESTNGPTPPVHVYNAGIDPDDNTVGYVRKLLNDITLRRSLDRESQTAPLYIAIEDDVTTTKVGQRMVSNLIQKFENNPHLDALTGRRDRVSSRVANSDMLLLTARTQDFIGVLRGQKRLHNPNVPDWGVTWARGATGSSNTAYTAEAYALVGGEDIKTPMRGRPIGERIAMIRGDGKTPNLDVVGTVSTRSEVDGAELRTDDDLDRINGSNQEVFANFLNDQVGKLHQTSPSPEQADQLSRRLLFWLGFKKDDYVYDKGRLDILNWEHVQERLENYRSRRASAAV